MRKSILAILILCASPVLYANGNDHNSHNHPHEHEPQIITNTVHTNTVVVRETLPDITHINNLDIQLSQAIAGAAAIAAIPGVSHATVDHGHTAVGTGMACYNNECSIAVGHEYQYNRFTSKASLAVSERPDAKDVLMSVGASYTY